MGFVTAELIRQAYENDEFVLVIIYGPLRYGKSSLAFKILAELYKTWNPLILKRQIGFHPKGVIDRWRNMAEKELAYVWDDAGLWLHALDWNDPFVKATGKYLNVAGTDWGGLILTAPLPTWISRKIRGIPQAITIKVTKASGNPSPSGRNRRIGTAYRWWQAPDMKHSGVHKLYQEEYDVRMPNDFYGWYKPYRDTFNVMAKQVMAKEISGKILE